jgi:hypothetical protein
MAELEKSVREIEMDGLLWGAAGLEDVGFGKMCCCELSGLHAKRTPRKSLGMAASWRSRHLSASCSFSLPGPIPSSPCFCVGLQASRSFALPASSKMTRLVLISAGWCMMASHC